MAGCAASLLDDTMWKCKANVCFSWGCRQAGSPGPFSNNKLVLFTSSAAGVLWSFTLSSFFFLFFHPACTLEEAEPETSFWQRTTASDLELLTFILSRPGPPEKKKKKKQLQSSVLESSPKNKKPFCDILEEGAVTPVVIKRLELNYLQRRRRNRLLCYFCPTKLAAKRKK